MKGTGATWRQAVLVACVAGLVGMAGAVSAVAQENLLANGSFEELRDGMPAGWQTMVGAGSPGATVESSWVLVGDAAHGERCLQLSGTLQTGIWLALISDAVPVRPGSHLRLSAILKTRDVERDGDQFVNCNVAVRFVDERGQRVSVGGYPVVGTEPIRGTRGWNTESGILHVPDAAVRAQVLCFLSMSGTAWFDDVSLSVIDEPEWRVRTTEHFNFYDQPGARITSRDRDLNEQYLAELEAALGLEIPHSLEFFRYSSNEQKGRITGRAGNGHVEGDRFLHSIWPVDRHEMVHLLTRQLGEPDSILFGEGIAVFLAGTWLGRDLDSWVLEHRDAGKLPSLIDVMVHERFKSFDDSVSYPVAGSFVEYLIGKYGMERFKLAYPREGRTADVTRFQRTLLDVYGASIMDLERAWLTMLAKADR